MVESSPLVALVMAGGSGTRFWPFSRKKFPKQFLNIVGNKSLLQQTVDRLLPVVPKENIFVCALEAHESILQEQFPHPSNLILEPQGKNTAPCLMLAVSELLRRGYPRETIMITCPADHYVGQTRRFGELLTRSVEWVKGSDGLLTFGVVPTSPHPGYGYIEAGGNVGTSSKPIYKVTCFLEKPDKQTAEQWMSRGNCFWNGGVFVWTLGTIVEAFKNFAGEDWNRISQTTNRTELREAYSRIQSQPIDIAVLEKASNVYVVPADIEWTDLGSWGSLYHLKEKNEGHVILSGQVKSAKSEGCLVQIPPNKKLALVGVRDLVIVENGDVLLIADRSEDQRVREISTEFE